MEVKWLKMALADLENEINFVASDNPKQAAVLLERVMSSVDALVHQPGIGRPGRIANTRELIIPDTRYLIPYRVTGNPPAVQILRVFHTSRRAPPNWSKP